jgi:5-methylthioadenosine/S-adenosylhomocysteine deaminase
MTRMDKVIHNGTVVTVDGAFRILTPGAVGIKDGVIHQVWSPDPRVEPPDAVEVIDAGGGLVMPGLVNTHSHLPMSLFRGLADDLLLDQWLNEHIFPAEAEHITPQSVVIGARLSVAEMLLSGTTTCCDGYFLVSDFAQSVQDSGIRAVLGQGVIDFPAPGVPDPTKNIAHAVDFVKKWQTSSGSIQPSIFCHSPYTCSDKTLRDAKSAANDLGVLFQFHVAETRFETQQCQAAHGCSPVKYLHRLGVLDDHTLMVHAVWVDADDIGIIRDSGAAVAHCPESNMKLASGIAPVPDFLNAGIPCGLGTDGCASNNDLSLFGEMHTAAIAHKAHRLDPTVMDAPTVVRMATIEGARALGMDHSIGSLEVGKQADVIILNSDCPHMTPLYHVPSHLVYAARGADVRHVLIGGQWVVRDGVLLTMNLPVVLSQARQMGRTITDT